MSAKWDQPTAYERWYASSLGRAYGASLARILGPWLAESVRSPVLDIGCGPGLAMERFFPEDAEVIGLDCSYEMLQRALRRTHRASHARQFVIGSIEKIPFAGEVFELVFCVNCLEFVTDREVAFGEIARVLRPAGLAIVGVLNRRSIWEMTRRFMRPFRTASYYRGRFFSIQDIRACCARAGLEVEAIRTGVYFPPVPPGPLYSVYDRMDQWSQRHSLTYGGMILCRVRKHHV